jgi:hypothetical protein
MQGLHFLQDLIDLSVLSLHVLLDLKSGLEHLVSILVSGLRTGGGGALHVLADDDDAQKDQLQEGLADPRDIVTASWERWADGSETAASAANA